MEAILFIGAQAAGKSSFYRERFFSTHVRISLDLLRTRHREGRLLNVCLETRQRFVIDNTNPQRVDRARYIGLARAAGFRVAGYYFRSASTEVLARNAARGPLERIPERGVCATLSRLELPSYAEGFDALYYVSMLEPAGFLVQEWVDEV